MGFEQEGEWSGVGWNGLLLDFDRRVPVDQLVVFDQSFQVLVSLLRWAAALAPHEALAQYARYGADGLYKILAVDELLFWNVNRWPSPIHL